MKKRKKAAAGLLALVLALSVLTPGMTALAAGGTQSDGTLDLSGNPDAASGDGWSWAGGTEKALTLSGADIRSQDGDGNTYGIKLPDGSTIVLTAGTANVIRAGEAAGGSGSFSHGVYSEGTLDIEGEGALYTIGGAADYSTGIIAGALTVNGGTVTAIGGTAASSFGLSIEAVTVNGGTVTATGGKSSNASGGVVTDTLSINGGTATFSGGMATNTSYGISAGEFTVNHTDEAPGTAPLVIARSSTAGPLSRAVNTAANVAPLTGMEVSDNFCIYGASDGFTVLTGSYDNAGDLAAAAGEAASYEGGVLTLGNIIVNSTANTYNAALNLSPGDKITLDGIAVIHSADSTHDAFGIYSYSALTIDGSGTLHAFSGVAQGQYACGIKVDNTTGTLTVDGCTVTATGGTAMRDGSGASRGILAYKLVANGGTVTGIGSATADNANGSYGICVGDINLNGSTVTGISGSAQLNSYAIYGEGTVSITDSTVTGISGPSKGSVGMIAIALGIEDSAVTASGGAGTTKSCGILSYTTFTVSGADTVVKARSGLSVISSWAICADNYYDDPAPFTITPPLAVVSPSGGGVGAPVTGIYGGSAARYIATTEGGATAAKAATIKIPPPLEIVTQPSGRTVTALENTSFSVSAVGCSSWQWQVSVNGGGTWSNVTDGGVYSGAATDTLSVTGADYGMNGWRYRVVVGSASDDETSSAALLTVNRKEIAVVGAAVRSKTYDGTTEAAVTDVTFSDAGTGMALGADYTVTASFGDRFTGTGKDVGVTVALLDTGTANNYSVAGLPYTASANITEAAQTIAATARDVAVSQSIDLRASVSSSAPGASFTFAIASGGGSLAGDGYTYTAPPDEGTVTIDVNSAAVDAGGTSDSEYAAAAQQTLTLTVVNKSAATITGITTPDKTYDGAGYAFSGTAAIQESDSGANGMFSYRYGGRDGTVYDSEAAPVQAGSYSLTVMYESDARLGSAAYTFAIAKKQLTLKADDKGVKVGGAMPAFTYTATGLIAGDSVATAPDLTTTAANTSTAGTYEIALTGGEADNAGSYEIIRQNGTLTVSAASSSGGGTPSKPTTYNAGVKAEGGSETTLPVTVDKNLGSASIDMGNQKLTWSGAVITLPTIPDVVLYCVGIPVSALSEADAQGALALHTEHGSLTVPSSMLTGVSAINGSKAEISIGQGDKSALPEDVKAAIGDRPLLRLSLSIDGVRTDWSNPDAPVTVSIPYTPAEAELANPESLVVWYIDGSGGVVAVPNGRYNPAAGTVTFTTTHFSDFAVGYNPVSFRDVAAGAWYSQAVGFIAARGVTTGMGDGTYSPETELTRGAFLVMLMRAYGIAPDADTADSFADAGNTYYTGYLAAAKRLGITAGSGNNLFAPDREITRQEMFTLLYNALGSIHQLPQGTSGKALSDFTDAGQIDTWAQAAMTLLVETGAVGGSGGRLTPSETTTRAEMAQVLYNLLAK